MGPTPVPRHVGVILDGNRRWAKNRGLPPTEGHRQGSQKLHDFALHAQSLGVEVVSVYGFSSENWSRPKLEVQFLMNLFQQVIENELKRFMQEGFRIVFLGSRAGLPAGLNRAMDAAEAGSQHNTSTTLAICLNYSGKQELSDAVARIIQNGVKPEDVSPQMLSDNLYHPEVPPIDLLVRTSGEQRLSGYMLWRSDYAELYFSEKMWPDFTVEDFDAALQEYARRQRRFGK